MRRQRAWGPGARAALGPGGGAHSRLQYGVSKNQPPDDRRIRSAVPQSWRRRRYLLAAAGSRRHVGIQPSRRGLASPSQFRSRLLEAATGLHRGRGPAGKEMARTVQQRRPRQLGRPDLRQGPSADARRAEPHLSGHLGQRTVSGARPAQAWRAPVPPAATRVVSAHRCPGDAVGRRAGVGTAAFRPADPHARRRRAHPAGWPWRGASLLQQRPSVSPHEPEAAGPDGGPAPALLGGAAVGSPASRPRPLAAAWWARPLAAPTAQLGDLDRALAGLLALRALHETASVAAAVRSALARVKLDKRPLPPSRRQLAISRYLRRRRAPSRELRS